MRTLLPLRLLPLLLLVVVLYGAALAPAAAAATYQVDPVHSSVLFKAKHLGVSNFYGRFNDISGTIDYDPADPAAGKVSLEIAAASVDTHDQRRDDHLRSPDFFNARQFPTITFRSTAIEPVDDDSFDVTGELTLHGVTQAITLRVERTGTGKHPQRGTEMVGFETSTSLQRSEFGMEFMQGLLSDEIGLIIAIEAGAR